MSGLPTLELRDLLSAIPDADGQVVLLCDKRDSPPAASSEASLSVPVDFEKDDLSRVLARAGWDRGSPAVVVWEGSTSRLSDAIVHETLCALARTLAAESRVIFRYAASGESRLFCIEPADLADYLGVRGFSLVSDVAEAGSEPDRIAVARRRADRKPRCGLRRYDPVS
jgi:O-methyltransferase involved in polyketide biosynthesis